MSWYYSYYLGLKDKNTNKIDMLGVYDGNGKLHDVLTKSRGFSSDLHDYFYKLNKSDFTEKAIKDLEIESYEDNELLLSYLPYSELPTGTFIKTGYFLISDIEEYENDNDADVFWDYLSPNIYAKKMENELKFGKNENDEYSCKDYSYYSFPDYTSKEYEAFIIKEAKDMLLFCEPEDKEVVIVLNQG